MLTNNGECVQELERRLAEYFDVSNVVCVSSGSAALQLIYKALGVLAINSPFSYVATTSTLRWEGLSQLR